MSGVEIYSIDLVMKKQGFINERKEKNMQKNNHEHTAALYFDGLTNFRDFGGYATTDGKRVRKGILFRSDELSKLSRADMARMNQIGLKLICDLRTETEQKSNKSRMLNQGVEVKNLAMQDKSQEFTRLEFIRYLIRHGKDIDFEQTMKDMYDHMGTGSKSTLQKLFTLLSEKEKFPILIHCTGGKDRTGFIVAIIQLFLGIPYESVLEDYLHSNICIGPRMKKAEKMIRLMSFYRVPAERIRPMLEVKRDYLEDVLQGIMSRHANIEEYLKNECGVSQQHLERFKELALE